MVQGGFGSAGSSRSLRRTASAVGVGSTARERERRAAKAPPIALDEPDRETILRAIETQQCCWCDDPRTFRTLGQHLIRMHGVDLHDLRERLALPARFPFASLGFRDTMRRWAAERDLLEIAHAAPRPTTHRSTAYARLRTKERIDAMTAEQRQASTEAARRAHGAAPPHLRSEWARRAASHVPPEHYVRMGRLGGAVRARQMAQPGVRAAMIATREANASEEYREGRAARMRAAQALRDHGADGRLGGSLGGAIRARQMEEPGVRAAMIAIREANATEEYREGRATRIRAAGAARAKLNFEIAALIRARLAEGGRTRDVAREFGVSKTTVLQVRRERIWRGATA